LRLTSDSSVGRISPPPSVHRHLQVPQVPLPPQAQGIRMSLSSSAASRVLPVGWDGFVVVVVDHDAAVALDHDLGLHQQHTPTSSRITARKTARLM
jgi:hypothetical protein